MDSRTEEQIVITHSYAAGSPEQSEVMGNGTRSPGSLVFSAMNSIEESEPPSPTAGPPINFGDVAPGIYRSSFPKVGNFEFMKTLGLRTILTLVDEEYPAANVEFNTSNGIRHVQVPIPANKDAFDVIAPDTMAKALEVLLNAKKYHPVLVHCNKGKHRTGCVIGIFRKVSDWSIPSIVEEYRNYAGQKARALDIHYIEVFDVNRIFDKSEGLTLAMEGTQTFQLITPPSSVKDDARDDYLTSVRRSRSCSKTTESLPRLPS